jgi:hypothetical protein
MYLTATDKTLEAVSDATATTTEPTVVIDYVDITTSAFTPGASLTSLNGTTTATIVSAPASSTYRQIKYINIYNADTVDHIVTVKHDDNGTERILWMGNIASSNTLFWTPEQGWLNTSDIVNSRYSGCHLYLSSNLTAQDFSTAAAISFDSETHDTDNYHDNSTNNSRITIPSGVRKVMLFGNVNIGSFTADESAILQITKNGSVFNGPSNQQENGTTGNRISTGGGPFDVSSGDYFELELDTEADTSILIENNRTYFGCIAIDHSLN